MTNLFLAYADTLHQGKGDLKFLMVAMMILI